MARVILKLFGKPVAVEEGGEGFRNAVCKARFETVQLNCAFFWNRISCELRLPLNQTNLRPRRRPGDKREKEFGLAEGFFGLHQSFGRGVRSWNTRFNVRRDHGASDVCLSIR